MALTKRAVKPSRKKIPQTVIGRTSRLLWSGARIAGKEIGGRIAAQLSDVPQASLLAMKIQQTQELVRTLSQLKGAAMKAGQLLSLELSDLLPPEVTTILRQLHDSGSSMPFEQVHAILKKDLGEARLARLANLTPEPIAAASIGQVHRAEVDGRPVVDKVQFPGIAKTIDSDLAVLRRVVGLCLQMQGKSIELTELFTELALGLKREADYTREAANVQAYRAALINPAYVVPEVYLDLTTKRVLTLSYESGVRIADWLDSRPDKAAVNEFAQSILTLLVEEFFVNGLVQTDPNYGNFLYRPDERRLVLLDLGAMSRYGKVFRRDIRRLLLAAVAGDEQTVLDMTLALGFLHESEAGEARRLFLDMLRLTVLPFTTTHQPFRFGDEAYLKEIRESAMRFVTAVRRSAPARQVIFLNRKLGGMFHLLKDADAVVDMLPFIERVRSLTI